MSLRRAECEAIFRLNRPPARLGCLLAGGRKMAWMQLGKQTPNHPLALFGA